MPRRAGQFSTSVEVTYQHTMKENPMAYIDIAEVKTRIRTEVDPYLNERTHNSLLHGFELRVFTGYASLDYVTAEQAETIIEGYRRIYGPDIRRDRHGLAVDLLHQTACRYPHRSGTCRCGYRPWSEYWQNAFWRGNELVGPREGLLDEYGRCKTLPMSEILRLRSTDSLTAPELS